MAESLFDRAGILVPTEPFSADERALARLAVDLGAETAGGGLSAAERAIVQRARELPASCAALLGRSRAGILGGADPLGAMLCGLRPPNLRRKSGAFYTPAALVEPMVAWALSRPVERFVDPGCGSGRFSIAALRRRHVQVVAIDSDSVATLLTRAALSVLGGRGARDAQVLNADYTTLALPDIAGRTAFAGNPPYVRHHELPAKAKVWALSAARRLGHRASGLAGLHAHFFLATALLARTGDVGCFVTSAEWLDVNYGSIIRDLLLGWLGGRSLHLIDPRSIPFDDAMTTAVVSCFEVGSAPESVRLNLAPSPEAMTCLDNGAALARATLSASHRWTPLFHDGENAAPASGTVPLKSIARVHRGTVTGANDFFVLTRHQAAQFGIEAWCRPAITSAREILQAGGVVRDGPERRLLLDIPKGTDRAAHPRLDAYLKRGEETLKDDGAIRSRYIPMHRNPWWFLGRQAAPPIVASYMARQAPIFALNPDGLALLNIAHGIYPHQPLQPDRLAALVAALDGHRDSYRGRGRTYHGGLEKFEPREMESLPVPAPAIWTRLSGSVRRCCANEAG